MIFFFFDLRGREEEREKSIGWCMCFGRGRFFQEKGQGSAVDMARRNWVRQTSEREDGMFDMVEKKSAFPQKGISSTTNGL